MGKEGLASPIPPAGLCLEKQHGATSDCFLRSPCKNGNNPQSTAANFPSNPCFLTQQDLTCSHILWGPFDLLRRGLVASEEPKHESEISCVL